MKLLITGGAGFIGSHLCESAISQGHSVIVLDDLSTGQLKNLSNLINNPSFTLARGSILDNNLVEKLINNVDGVLHFAAAVGVKKILSDPIGSLLTNIQGTETVLGIAARLQKRTMLASSSEIYGKNPSMPLHEDSDRVLGSPLIARWTYSEAKAIDEAYARNLYEQKGFKVTIVRLFNTVGPRQSDAYGMVIPRFFNASLNNDPILIHGDGTQQRVFCHIDDAISAIFSLWDLDDGYGEAFNIGGLEEVSINGLATRIKQMTNSQSKIIYQSYSELAKDGFEDVLRRVPSNEKIFRFTGWSPKRNLQVILEDFLKSVQLND